jgi:hypothetical protein
MKFMPDVRHGVRRKPDFRCTLRTLCNRPAVVLTLDLVQSLSLQTVNRKDPPEARPYFNSCRSRWVSRWQHTHLPGV